MTATSTFSLTVLSHTLIFLIRHSSVIISPHQCRHHYSCHPSPHHSFIPISKLFFFSNPTFHKHLASFRTGFTDLSIDLCFFHFIFIQFQLAFLSSILFFLISRLSYNRLFLDFWCFTFPVPFKTGLVLCSLWFLVQASPRVFFSFSVQSSSYHIKLTTNTFIHSLS